ncbi:MULTISPECIES: class I SAM-dependent methyltransferase [unclassified Beijerinckia]|uniref:class I SAM-dependent methyltransferase n=1 Tax=unclassified Beijerinckia TaxID=2638183 RepID=UPI00147BFC94|nr:MULTISPECIES: class I SAM-dependent methyltransferase [unclassified Beijerinckia]
MFPFLKEGLLPELTALEQKQEQRFAELRQRIATLDDRALELATQIAAGDQQVVQTIHNAVERTTTDRKPNITPLAMVLQEIAILRWNVKLLGAAMARELYDAAAAGPLAPVPAEPSRVGLSSKLCRQADIESDWMRYWCGQLRLTPIYSRKIWELCFVLQALWEAGLLESGRSGLGFAVGAEPIPAFLAARGAQILATDLAPDDERSVAWTQTNQHAANLAQLYRAEFLDQTEFDRLCRFRSVDMNQIPADLDGQFDFCWSMCSFEHVGSIELGLQFVANSVKCLKPGGLAVHTTEYSFEAGDETIDNWPTVLFQERHIAELDKRLRKDGHELVAVDYNPGDRILDSFIDGPPYAFNPRPTLTFPETPHIRLSIGGFACTSIGLIIRAAR